MHMCDQVVTGPWVIDVCNNRVKKLFPICSAWGLAEKGGASGHKQEACSWAHTPNMWGRLLFQQKLLPAVRPQGRAEGTLDRQVSPTGNTLRRSRVQSETLL